ncbi:MAG: 16S rRNA (cytosine(1402)-N(4))-methyltransferase RsmH [Vicinamibacterales bacterium]
MPSGQHRPIMVAEAISCLRPAPGDLAVDCTLGGGGHARAILERIRPNGRLLGVDVDPIELRRTEAALRGDGFDSDVFTACHGSFAQLPERLVAAGLPVANLILADLGVSSMQIDDPSRGFSYKAIGPLDMRMDPSQGEPASQLIARLSEAELVSVLTDNADEPHAEPIARLLKRQPLTTTRALEQVLRVDLSRALPDVAKADLKMSNRRTFQALRIAVNDEFGALERLLQALPRCLAPDGRVAIITFHSGEDRRVKQAFRAGLRAGVYAEVATAVIRSSKAETFANRRASAAKLRWAVRASP